MTNGIEVRDVVRIKASGEKGTVVALEEVSDRLPASVMVEILRCEYSEIFKCRVDEVEKVSS